MKRSFANPGATSHFFNSLQGFLGAGKKLLSFPSFGDDVIGFFKEIILKALVRGCLHDGACRGNLATDLGNEVTPNEVCKVRDLQKGAALWNMVLKDSHH